MGIVTRTLTYPDGRVVEEVIDMAKQEVSKRVESKTDEPKSKPKQKRKTVRKAHTTSSSS